MDSGLCSSFLRSAAVEIRTAARPIRFSLAALASVASVHVLFTIPFLLLAFCAGSRRHLRRTSQLEASGMVLSIGALSAISLLPYVPATAMRQMECAGADAELPLAWFFFKLYERSPSRARGHFVVWLALSGLHSLRPRA